MSRAAYILLPPSESKEPGGRRLAAPGSFDSALAQPREELRAALARTLASSSAEHISKVLNVRGANLDRALAATRQLLDGTAPLLPAWRRYSGVVWSHLDPASLTHHHRRRILIPSGVYGLTRATDAVADYRLNMKVSLDGLGNVAKFWRLSLSAVLDEMGDVTLINLLPKEHLAALEPNAMVARPFVNVTFQRHDGEGVAGHDAKAVKGIVARRILVDGLGGIENFKWRGWRGAIRDGEHVIRAPQVSESS